MKYSYPKSSQYHPNPRFEQGSRIELWVFAIYLDIGWTHLDVEFIVRAFPPLF